MFRRIRNADAWKKSPSLELSPSLIAVDDHTIGNRFTVDPSTGIIRHGLFRVMSDGDVDLVVT
jgi:hypothetical protein